MLLLLFCMCGYFFLIHYGHCCAFFPLNVCKAFVRAWKEKHASINYGGKWKAKFSYKQSERPSKFFWIPFKKKKKRIHENIALEMLSGKVQCASLSNATSVPYARTCGVPNRAVAPPPVKWKVWHFGWYSCLISGWEENWRIHHFGLSSAPRQRSYSTTSSCGETWEQLAHYHLYSSLIVVAVIHPPV